ncbi:MAG: M42 family metallopeptidase [Kiritimatiellaeota bacterium]|nr:M42 family metallopeptidase [Kiritimatiellota bacterium]
MSKKSLKFLEELLNTSGPSGFEEKTAKCYRGYLAEFADEVRTDVTGNTIGVVNGGAEFKVMLAGHYDEIGFQITHISDEGLLYFRNVGGIDKTTISCIEVEVITEKHGKIPGVIGKKPIHLLTPKERERILELKEMWIDIGAESKKAAEKLVTIGDPVAFRSNCEFLDKNRVKSKGLDDKIGAFVIAESLRELSKRKIAVAVYAVGTVQEEVGLRGAATSAFGINPNVGIAVDVGFATDIPDVDKKELGVGEMGKGPFLERNADNNPVLGRLIRKTAAKYKIPVQEKAGFRASGGTDTARMQLTRSGVATALISIPNRYMHTPVEMCDLRDVEAAVKLIVGTVSALKPGDTFIPGLS